MHDNPIDFNPDPNEEFSLVLRISESTEANLTGFINDVCSSLVKMGAASEIEHTMEEELGSTYLKFKFSSSNLDLTEYKKFIDYIERNVTIPDLSDQTLPSPESDLECSIKIKYIFPKNEEAHIVKRGEARIVDIYEESFKKLGATEIRIGKISDKDELSAETKQDITIRTIEMLISGENLDPNNVRLFLEASNSRINDSNS